MKINPISTTLYTPKVKGFGHSAVPYPEYEKYQNQSQTSTITRFVDKLSALFTPEVTQKSQEIKKSIDEIYNSRQNKAFNGSPKDHLLSVLA